VRELMKRPTNLQCDGPKEVADCFDISESCTYFVQYWIKIPEQFGGGEFRSNVITVTIKPR